MLRGLALPRFPGARQTGPKPLRIQAERLTYPNECEGRFGVGRVEPLLSLSERPSLSRLARERIPEKSRGGVLENREHQTFLRLQHGGPTIEDLRRQHDLVLQARAPGIRLVAAGARGFADRDTIIAPSHSAPNRRWARGLSDPETRPSAMACWSAPSMSPRLYRASISRHASQPSTTGPSRRMMRCTPGSIEASRNARQPARNRLHASGPQAPAADASMIACSVSWKTARKIAFLSGK